MGHGFVAKGRECRVDGANGFADDPSNVGDDDLPVKPHQDIDQLVRDHPSEDPSESAGN